MKFECSTFEEAKNKAADDAASSFSLALQVITFEQAGRTCYSTSLPLSKLRDLIKFDSAERGDTAPERKTNRPVMPDHVRNIKDYLVQQDQYILPSITLNVRDELRCYTYATTAATRAAILIIPAGTQFHVTDGQHRLRAIEEALQERPNLANDAVSVMIVEEGQIDRIHQDFADCAQTKAIPPSLLTLYNYRDDLSHLTRSIAEEVEYFQGRTEKVGKTVAKNSQNIYTLNQLRVSIAELLTGDASASTATLRKRCAELLQGQSNYDSWFTKVSDFYSQLAESIPEWRQVVDANSGGTPVDMSDLRYRYIHFTGTGLTILGRVGHEILRITNPVTRRQKVTELATKINWSRDTSDGRSFWDGSILTRDGGLLTSKAPMTEAVIRVKKALELDLSERERNYIAEAAGVAVQTAQAS